MAENTKLPSNVIRGHKVWDAIMPSIVMRRSHGFAGHCQ